MFIRIPGAVFKVEINKLMRSNQKVAVNFKLKENVLFLQAADLVIDDIQLEVSEYDINDTTELTVYIDQTLNLISDKDLVVIDVRGELMEIKQGSFVYSAIALPELRIEDNVFQVEKTDILYKDEMIRYINSTKSLDEIAKTLAVSSAPIYVCDDIAYLYYSNTVYISRLRLPNCALCSELARKLVNILSTSDGLAKYKFNQKTGLMYIAVRPTEVVSLATQKVNNQIIQGIKSIQDKLQTVTHVRMYEYREYMNIICKVYKKMLIELSICENGLRLYVDNGKTRFDIGSVNQCLFSIKISTAQLSAIYRLFGNDMDVIIKRGENCLCLMETNSEKTLLVSGMLY